MPAKHTFHLSVTTSMIGAVLFTGCTQLAPLHEKYPDIAPVVYYCPDEDTIFFNQSGGAIFEAYRRRKKTEEGFSSTEEGRLEFEAFECAWENFACVEFRPAGKANSSFKVAVPDIAQVGRYAKGDVTVNVEKIDGLYGENRRHLTVWQTTNGRRQSVSAVIEQGKGIIYFRGFNFSDLESIDDGEVCVLQTDIGFLSSSFVPGGAVEP